MNQQSKTEVELSVKSQTIFFETSQGEIKRHHFLGANRLNHQKAIELLSEKGYEVKLLLKVTTERLTLAFTEQEIEERILSSEQYYNQK